MLLIANLLAGMAATVMMARVVLHMRGAVIPHDWRDLTEGDFMRLSVLVFHIKGALRITFYDVVIVLILWERAPWVSWANIAFCLMAVVASWLALRALKG